MSTIEVVILAPILITFVLFVVALGLLANAKGKAYGAARDASRAGALQRDAGSAMAAARSAAAADLGNSCSNLTVSDAGSTWQSGGMVSIRVDCDVSLGGLGMLGLGGVRTVSGQAGAPIDTLRRWG